MKLILSLALLLPFTAEASVKFLNNDGVEVGTYNEVKCGDNVECSQSAGKLLLELEQNPTGLLQTRKVISGELSIADCGSTISNTAEAFYFLPDVSGESAVGCRLTFIVGHASNLRIKPATNEEIIQLLTNAAGDDLQADAVGESVVLEAIAGGLNPIWAPVGAEKGTWSDIN